MSGGDAMIEIVLPKDASAAGLKVEVGGRDLSAAFAVRADGRIKGLLTGLAVGDNIVTAQTDSASAAQLTLTNADRGGPVYSGEQIMPFICATPVPQGATANAPATNASGLATAATDAQVQHRDRVQAVLQTPRPAAAPRLPDPSPNVAFNNPAPATTARRRPTPASSPTPGRTGAGRHGHHDHRSGLTVPYIVRVERGTMNRGIYDIAVLFDPTKAWQPTQPQAQWNGKVLYHFGASTGQPRRQVRPATAWSGATARSAAATWWR